MKLGIERFRDRDFHSSSISPRYLTFFWLFLTIFVIFYQVSKISKSLKKQGKTSDILDYLRNYKET